MKRLTPEDLEHQMRAVLMRYTPEALKRCNRNRLLAELAATFAGHEVLSFVPRGVEASMTSADAQRAAAARNRQNAEALEKVARDAITAILAVVEVRQR